MERVRSWVFTVNNYTEEDEHQVWALSVDSDVAYAVVGKEVGEENMTPHLQGFIHFREKKSLRQCQCYFPTAHFERRRGTFKEASQYCKKDGDFFEVGDLPMDDLEKGKAGGDASVELWEETLKCVREGRIVDVPVQMTHHLKAALFRIQQEKIEERNVETLDGPLLHEWWYGAPGTGKTSKALADYPGAYIKDPKERWWDGYTGQDTVIIDDFDKYQVSMAGDMKRWLDRYPFQAPVKGGYLLIRPVRIIVTSNYKPEEIWEDTVTQLALGRRVHVVRFDIL